MRRTPARRTADNPDMLESISFISTACADCPGCKPDVRWMSCADKGPRPGSMETARTIDAPSIPITDIDMRAAKYTDTSIAIANEIQNKTVLFMAVIISQRLTANN